MTDAKFTIVLVEDDADEAALLCHLLERRGYRCLTVTSGEQCLETIAREAVDVVITGMHMPGISGVDLCATLNGRYPQLPVIVLSGQHARFFHDRAFAYVVKPVKLEVLEGTIKRALDLHPHGPAGSPQETGDA